MLGAQLDLFGDRHLRLENARRALAGGRLEDAWRELVRLRSCYPDDAAIAAELDANQRLMARLGEIDARVPGERARLLLQLTRTAHPSLRGWLLRRAATELHRASGPTALLDGRSASVLLLEAREVHTAWAIAAEAVRESPRARFLAYLADVEHRLEHRSRARARYREALALDPHDIDWDEVADDDVKTLPDIAQGELELEDGVAWAAPVGVVMKVLPVGDPPPTPADGDLHAPPGSALEQAREFLRALIRATHERGTHAIDARRQMRALAPQLLAAYLETK